MSRPPERPAYRLDAQADRIAEWLQLLGAVRRLCQSLDAVMAPFDLGLRDYELLRCLPGRTLSQAAIVRRLQSNKVSVSRGVRRLNARGWLSVDILDADKRISSVALTDRGAEQLAEIEAELARFLGLLAARLDAEERGIVGRINAALRHFNQVHGSDAPCTEEQG